MSRTRRLSITVLFVSLVFGITTVRQAAGQPSSEQELADSYQEIIGGLETIPIDSGELLEQAEGLSQKLKSDIEDLRLRFKNIKAGRGAGAAVPESIVEGVERFVSQDNLIPLVQSLGEASLRIHAARHWTEAVLRGERKGFFLAGVQVKMNNRAEIQRAYRDYHAALLIRQDAMNKLAALFSGRAKVVAQLSSAGGGLAGQRDATPEEAFNFASGLHATDRKSVV